MITYNILLLIYQDTLRNKLSMNYKKLGNTDLDVSTICLGTMTWGEQNTQNEGFEQMDYALDQGVNFWDTAEIYSIPPKQETFGDTEVIIGNWFEKTKKRDKIILASKVCGPMREYVRGGGNQFGTKNITEALEGSLKRLKTDYIDFVPITLAQKEKQIFLENWVMNTMMEVNGLSLKIYCQI